MTCFRGAEVCTEWLQDDDLTQHDNKLELGHEMENSKKMANPELSMAW